MQTIRLIAILGGSGSGKSALGLELAQKLNCEIFSLDSLAIYQELDIVSAKPTQEELDQVLHYGINVLKPNEHNNAQLFKELLFDAIKQTQNKGKETLLIIGGSSFYLKSIIEGLSPMPQISQKQKEEITQKILSLSDPFAFLQEIDSQSHIHPNDTHRLHKALEIYFSTNTPPSVFFQTHQKIPFPYQIEIYSIAIQRQLLRERIQQRTQKMLHLGILDEIQSFMARYGFINQPSNAIGVKECIEYLTQTPLEILQESKTPLKSKKIAKNPQELCELISTHTAQLAKRQETFNRTQFSSVLNASTLELKNLILGQ